VKEYLDWILSSDGIIKKLKIFNEGERGVFTSLLALGGFTLRQAHSSSGINLPTTMRLTQRKAHSSSGINLP